MKTNQKIQIASVKILHVIDGKILTDVTDVYVRVCMWMSFMCVGVISAISLPLIVVLF